jgi:hypothetical protein
LLARLAKLSAVSSQLRTAATKQASILGAVGKAGFNVASKGLGVAMKHPLATLTAVSSAQGALGKAREYNAGFQPEVQRQMLGQPPMPPEFRR